MNVGTIPLIVQVPEMAPMRNRMTRAVVTSPMLLFIASSKLSQGTLNIHIDSQTQTPAEKRRDTWLAPRMASLPNMLISKAKRTIKVNTGIKEIPSLDRFLRAILSNSFDNSAQYRKKIVIFMQDFRNPGFSI